MLTPNFGFRPTPRNLFFEGNSLQNNIVNANIAGGQYIPNTAYSTVIGTNKKLSAWFLAIGGQNQTTINSNFSTRIQPYLKPNDIYFIWEGLNDMRGGLSLSGAAAYANLITCVNNIHGLGGRVIVGTVTKSNFTGDRADLATDVDIYNGLVRTNSNLFEAVADIGGDTHFDQVSDTTDATYYLTDFLHLATTGQNLAASYISTAILSVLSTYP